MSKIGTADIGGIMLGSTEIVKAYLGTDVVFQKSSLPYDAEVEYLESTGTQYINLGKALNSATDVIEIEFCMTEELAGGYKLFGARSGASSKNFSLITSNPNIICIDLQNASYSTYRVTYTYEVGVYYTVHMERTLRSASVDGVVIASKTNSSQSFTTAAAAYLFSFNQSGNTWSYGHCRIKSFTWKRSGADYMDLVPVRVGQVGYMYDKVSGNLLGNAGTGNFLFGNDVNV
jgi:hypothetical protein